MQGAPLIRGRLRASAHKRLGNFLDGREPGCESNRRRVEQFQRAVTVS
jgi:hypothetical protein